MDREREAIWPIATIFARPAIVYLLSLKRFSGMGGESEGGEMILLGDCLERLKELEENSVDAVVTDPPYGLKFMGKKWDYDVPKKEMWQEVLRVLKPGGHLLSFGGTRTYHRLTSAIEDAGFEIRDQLQWLYGSGFPKSLDISKAIDRKFGAKREVIGQRDVGPDMNNGSYNNASSDRMIMPITKPSTPEAYRYKGWGTALKPANEPIVLARKPLERGLTVAQNMLKWGIGGLNIDISRIGACKDDDSSGDTSSSREEHNRFCILNKLLVSFSCEPCEEFHLSSALLHVEKLCEALGFQFGCQPFCHLRDVLLRLVSKDDQGAFPSLLGVGGDICHFRKELEDNPLYQSSDRLSSVDELIRVYDLTCENNPTPIFNSQLQGRWPANLLMDEHAAALLDEQSGIAKAKSARTGKPGGSNACHMSRDKGDNEHNADSIGYWPEDQGGGASRFFYVAKASKRERNAGLDGMPEKLGGAMGGGAETRPDRPPNLTMRANHHPTVKPIKLMEYLCKLICPPGGTILDPFCGSGSTLVAAFRLGFKAIGIEQNAEYCAIAERRIAHAKDIA